MFVVPACSYLSFISKQLERNWVGQLEWQQVKRERCPVKLKIDSDILQYKTCVSNGNGMHRQHESRCMLVFIKFTMHTGLSSQKQ